MRLGPNSMGASTSPQGWDPASRVLQGLWAGMQVTLWWVTPMEVWDTGSLEGLGHAASGCWVPPAMAVVGGLHRGLLPHPGPCGLARLMGYPGGCDELVRSRQGALKGMLIQTPGVEGRFGAAGLAALHAAVCRMSLCWEQGRAGVLVGCRSLCQHQFPVALGAGRREPCPGVLVMGFCRFPAQLALGVPVGGRQGCSSAQLPQPLSGTLAVPRELLARLGLPCWGAAGGSGTL